MTKLTKERIKMVVDVVIEYNNPEARMSAIKAARELYVETYGTGCGDKYPHVRYGAKSGRVVLQKDAA